MSPNRVFNYLLLLIPIISCTPLATREYVETPVVIAYGVIQAGFINTRFAPPTDRPMHEFPNLNKATIRLLEHRKEWWIKMCKPMVDSQKLNYSRWDLDSATIVSLFKSAIPTSLHSLDNYTFVPAVVLGRISVNGLKYFFLINSGGFMQLFTSGDDGKTFSYIWKDKRNLKSFIRSCD